jgi:NCK-associated protein 1
MKMATSRLTERLLLHVDKGQGLLLRLYNIKKDLDDPNSDISFLKEKPFQAIAKHVASTSAKTSLFSVASPGGKATVEINRTSPKIRKHLNAAFDTLLDVASFYESLVRSVFPDCKELSLDTTRTPDLAKMFLDLVATYVSLLVLLSRLGEERKLIPWLMIQLGDVRQNKNSNLEPEFQFLCDPVLSTRPLLLAYLSFVPFQDMLKNAFLSSICFAFVGLRSSCDQWMKQQFLSLFTTDGGGIDLPSSTTSKTGDGSGFPLGVEIADLERTEMWLFCGFTLCHHVVDPAHKEAGEYRIWATLMQGLWVLPIIR